MEQKRKIIIPVGSDPEKTFSGTSFDGGATIPTPHFDAEATLGARPVVPLAHNQTSSKPSRSLLLIALIVGAISVGVAGGLAIGFYHNRQKAESTVAAQPSSAAASVDTRAEENSPKVSSEEPLLSAPALPETKESTEQSMPSQPTKIVATEERDEPSASAKTSTSSTDRTVRESQKRDDKRVSSPPVVREKTRDDRATDVRDKNRQARRRTRDDEQPEDLPRQIERAGRQQMNRIREIFEGTQP